MNDDGDLVIRADGLTKSFGDFVVVRDLDLNVKRGQIFGFLGPNGSGKTTTMRMLVGLLKPDGGSCECLGMDITTEQLAIRKQVGYMTQHFSLYDDLTVIENLQFIAQVYGLPSPRQLAADTAREIGLESRSNQLVRELSGGWKQRLALAAATLPKPKLLLLDEPTAGVDPQARREFWDRIYELAADGLTVLVSTHYMDEAERCHAIAYLAYGELLASGTVEDLIDGAGLTMWQVSGSPSALHRIVSELRDKDEVAMATPLGTELRVGGTDPDALERVIAPYRSSGETEWRTTKPSLEDLFIHLLARSRDNRLAEEEGGL